MNGSFDLYSFVYRGILAEEAIGNSLPAQEAPSTEPEDDFRRRMPLDSMDDAIVSAARKMAWVYVAIASFENGVRSFIEERLAEKMGAEWFNTAVSSDIKTQIDSRRKEEEQIRWHSARGASLLSYAQLGDLASIIQKNHIHFRELIPSIEWARELFRSIERSRNVIMHSGQLKMGDVERVAMYIRDWIQQVGG